MAEDINQLTGRGIPIIKELAKQFGVSESEVQALVTAGKVGFPELQKAFQSMTAEGGQFSGMMAAQSKTMSGLWSTFTDTIGMTMAGLVTQIVESFKLKDALASLTGFIGTAGAWISSIVTAWMPVVIGFAQTLYSTVAGWLSALWGFVQPIVASIAAWFASNLQTLVASVASSHAAIWSAVSGVFTAVWGIITTVGNGIAAAWTWAMNLLGVKTEDTGTKVGNVFASIMKFGEMLLDGFTTVLITIGYALPPPRPLPLHRPARPVQRCVRPPPPTATPGASMKSCWRC